MLIFDSHAHVIPALGGASGYSSIEHHATISQMAMRDHLSQPPRRMVDNEIIRVKKLWNPADLSVNGRRDVGFHAGEYGRFVWEQDGDECYIQYLPPYAADMSYPVGMLKAMMDYTGVHKAVLQCGGVYGRLNRFYADLLIQRPEYKKVFYPLASLDPVTDGISIATEEANQSILRDGLAGLWLVGEEHLFTKAYGKFWDTISELNVPVFLAFFPDEGWCERVLAIERWIDDYPDMPIVLPQAFPLKIGASSLEIPAVTRRLLLRGRLLIEVIYPISQGNREDYPFPISQAAVKSLYDDFGPERLAWGSDIPMVERYCTYTQSLTYLTHYADYLTPEERALILGENLAAHFGERI